MIRPKALAPWAFGFILIIGAALRIGALKSDALWYDELASYFFASAGGFQNFLTTYFESRDPIPGGYYLLHYLWLKFVPHTEVWVRIPSTIAGIAAIAAIYQFNRIVFDRSVGLVSALWVAFAMQPIWASIEMRPYAFILLLTALYATAVALWIKCFDTTDKPPILRLLVIAALLSNMHYFGILFVLMGFGLLGFLSWRSGWRHIRELFLAGVGCFVSILPWVWGILQNLVHSPNNETIPSVGFYKMIRKFSEYTFLATEGHEALILDLMYKFLIGMSVFIFILPLLILILEASWKTWPRFTRVLSEKKWTLFILSMWIVIPFLLCWLKDLTGQPVFRARYMVICLPAFYGLMSYFIVALMRRFRPVILLLLVIPVAAYSHLEEELKLYSSYERSFVRDEFKIAEQWLAENASERRLVICGFNRDFMRFYFQAFPEVEKNMLFFARCWQPKRLAEVEFDQIQWPKELRILSVNARPLDLVVDKLKALGYSSKEPSRRQDVETVILTR